MNSAPTFLYGIDYGSKLAGTTAIAQFSEKQAYVKVKQSSKKQDADAWLLQEIPPHSLVFIDAPLSLPGVYTQVENAGDYFYRQADRELKAMSPMFLGGLTARAIRLRDQWMKKSIRCKEVYPGGLVRLLELPEYQKKNKELLPAFWEHVSSLMPIRLQSPPQNWHQMDAILALWSGLRFSYSFPSHLWS